MYKCGLESEEMFFVFVEQLSLENNCVGIVLPYKLIINLDILHKKLELPCVLLLDIPQIKPLHVQVSYFTSLRTHDRQAKIFDLNVECFIHHNFLSLLTFFTFNQQISLCLRIFAVDYPYVFDVLLHNDEKLVFRCVTSIFEFDLPSRATALFQ
jgi:hypothetical protein